MRRFKLYRKVDISGVSGTGYVAEGCQFHDGRCLLSWLDDTHSSLNIYKSIDDIIFVHGHQGATEVHFLDPEEEKVTTE